MSIYRARLRIIAPFVVFATVVVILLKAFAPPPAPWTAGVPWVLLVVFWVYLAVMTRRERRRGREI